MDVTDIDTITVLGAGNMGHGITEVAALAGYNVRMRDIDEDIVENGMDQIEWSLGKLTENEQISEDEANAALDRIEPLVDMETAVRETDFVIEAVSEKMEIKKEVYEEIDELAPESAIFATNTSSLSITELANVTDREEKFCGMHFFNPPVKMQLVEVIAGEQSTEETLEVTEELAESMGKTTIRVHKDSPGFIVNRVLVPLMNEAAWMVHTDAATIAEIDSATKYNLGLPMGTFELADQVGIDVSYHVLDYMHQELGDAYEPCPLLEEKVEANELGKKTDEGFYEYTNGGVEIPTDAGNEEIVRRLQAIMANEVAKLIENDVADAEAIDEAVMLGAGFPEGPATMADNAGLPTLHETLQELYSQTDAARYKPASKLTNLSESNQGFYATEEESAEFEQLRIEKPGDSVGKLVLDREHRMNSITPTLLDELVEAIDQLEDDEDVQCILVTGAGDRAFSAGADVQSMASRADPISGVELSKQGQNAFGELEKCDLPVIVAIDGYCLGGGMELATCADLRIASSRSELGQPEHDLGLLPGWGGSQRLKHIVGEGRAKEIIFTADRYDPETLEEYGFINEVVPTDEFEDRAHELAAKLASGPPIAQQYTKRAMLKGRDDTTAGLEIENQAFGHLLGTDDVMEGISAYMEDREPEFEGK
ncbi:MAG: 3-hydroxyacyl-CoA dehydrogenase NAD-binding domain-containing protein [Halobacteriaceae archaeon]